MPSNQSASRTSNIRSGSNIHFAGKRQPTRRYASYAFAGGNGQSGEFWKYKAGIALSSKGERREKDMLSDANQRPAPLSARSGRDLGFFLDQFTKDGRNFFELGGFIQKQIRAGA